MTAKTIHMARNSSNPKEKVINQLAEHEPKWFAVYTRFKCEKYVLDHLQKKNIEAYVPVMTKTRKYGKKIRQSDIPLINCYVFVQITKSQYVRTLETEYVIKFLRQGKDLLAIPQHEIDILKRVSGEVEEAEILDDRWMNEGSEVEVTSGYLTGMQGKIISKSGKRSFYVDLKTIGFQLRVKIDFNLLKPVVNNFVVI